MRNEKINLAILLLVTILLSIYLFFHTYVISLDGAFQYIPIAKDFVSGLYGKALTHNQQPLYSFLVAFVSRWVSDFELAGKLVSSILGILIIFPVYFLGKRIFDRKIAFLSALLLTAHPYIRRFSGDVLKESTYLFFLAMAIWFTWRTIQDEKRYPYLLIPLFSVLAYLVRPDGIEVLLVAFFYILFIKKFDRIGGKWTPLFLFLVSSAILLLPYLLHLRETTGVWTLSRAKTMTLFLGLEATEGASLIHKIVFTFKKLNSEALSIYHPFYIFLLVIGLLKRRPSHFKRGEGFLFSLFMLHYVVLFLFVLNITEWSGKETIRTAYFSGRHVLPLLLFSIYWVGEGILVLYDWIYKKMESKRSLHLLESKRRSAVVWGILFILISAVVLPKTLKPQRYERLPEKEAGIWIKDRFGKGMTVFTSLPRIAFYADGNCEYIDFKKDRLDKVKSKMAENGVLYLAIRGRENVDFPEVAVTLKRDFIELNRFEGEGMEKVIVYTRGQ